MSVANREIDDPDYWWYRAEELRAKADGVREFEARRALMRAHLNARQVVSMR
jgi:hypothetical protein